MLKRKPSKTGAKPMHSRAFMLQVVQELLVEELSFAEVGARYNVNKSTVNYWYKKFSSELGDETIIAMDTAGSGKEENQAEEIKRLKSALAEANLRVTVMETLIDVAEEELQIDIRKKSGTKQRKEQDK